MQKQLTAVLLTLSALVAQSAQQHAKQLASLATQGLHAAELDAQGEFSVRNAQKHTLVRREMLQLGEFKSNGGVVHIAGDGGGSTDECSKDELDCSGSRCCESDTTHKCYHWSEHAVMECHPTAPTGTVSHDITDYEVESEASCAGSTKDCSATRCCTKPQDKCWGQAPQHVQRCMAWSECDKFACVDVTNEPVLLKTLSEQTNHYADKVAANEAVAQAKAAAGTNAAEVEREVAKAAEAVPDAENLAKASKIPDAIKEATTAEKDLLAATNAAAGSQEAGAEAITTLTDAEKALETIATGDKATGTTEEIAKKLAETVVDDENTEKVIDEIEAKVEGLGGTTAAELAQRAKVEADLEKAKEEEAKAEADVKKLLPLPVLAADPAAAEATAAAEAAAEAEQEAKAAEAAAEAAEQAEMVEEAEMAEAAEHAAKLKALGGAFAEADPAPLLGGADASAAGPAEETAAEETAAAAEEEPAAEQAPAGDTSAAGEKTAEKTAAEEPAAEAPAEAPALEAPAAEAAEAPAEPASSEADATETVAESPEVAEEGDAAATAKKVAISPHRTQHTAHLTDSQVSFAGELDLPEPYVIGDEDAECPSQGGGREAVNSIEDCQKAIETLNLCAGSSDPVVCNKIETVSNEAAPQGCYLGRPYKTVAVELVDFPGRYVPQWRGSIIKEVDGKPVAARGSIYMNNRAGKKPSDIPQGRPICKTVDAL